MTNPDYINASTYNYKAIVVLKFVYMYIPVWRNSCNYHQYHQPLCSLMPCVLLQQCSRSMLLSSEGSQFHLERSCAQLCFPVLQIVCCSTVMGAKIFWWTLKQLFVINCFSTVEYALHLQYLLQAYWWGLLKYSTWNCQP